MVTPAAERKAVAHLVEHHAMSERRACKAIGCCRMTVRYQSARPEDRSLRDRMIEIARERRRFGYRRPHVLLKREGHLVNHKRLFRLYREEKLAVRRRGGRNEGRKHCDGDGCGQASSHENLLGRILGLAPEVYATAPS